MTTTRTGWFEGRAVAYARDDMGMSQAEFAQALTEATGNEWNQAKVSRIERGQTPMTTPELRAIAELQGRTWEWYFDGPNYERFIVGGDSQRSLHPVGVNGSDVAVITKTDDEAAAGGFRKRPRFLGGAMDLLPKPSTVVETPQLFDDVVIDLDDEESVDHWFDFLVERQSA